MKNSIRLMMILSGVAIFFISCKKDDGKNTPKFPNDKGTAVDDSATHFDSTAVATFFTQHPKLKDYESQVRELYRKHQWHFVWYEDQGMAKLGRLLHDKINTIETEGVNTEVPYKEKLEQLFEKSASQKPTVNKDVLISALYFFYADKVLNGLDVNTTRKLGWYLPRKKMSPVNYLDTLMANPHLIDKNEKAVITQYYRLKSVLQHYRDMQKKAAWDSIPFDPKMDPIAVGDSAEIVSRVRQRLYVMNYLKADSKSNLYDESMGRQVRAYKKNVGLVASTAISGKMIRMLNISLESRIKTIRVNMERCRWIPNDFTKADEYIAINIPSYQLTYFKKGQPVLRSNVVVGKVMNQTVIFSGMMKFIVFSPYWNVPKSIVDKEIKPALAKNKDYLEQHNMERHEGQIRQKPGPENSLGLVKFLFPNSNNIYLHDSPAKSLFNQASRAFSHGCIRVAKPVELANKILEDDENWSPEKIDEAMHKGEESWYTLKKKIPVYIGYFTAWVDDANNIHFYDDVYKRDAGIAGRISKE